MDDSTKATVQKIPLLTTNAGPRDGEQWVKRLKEEYAALIKVLYSTLLKLIQDSSFKSTKKQIMTGFNSSQTKQEQGTGI
jgi:hypothetical protein